MPKYLTDVGRINYSFSTIVAVGLSRLYFDRHNQLLHRDEIQNKVNGAKCVVTSLAPII
jgi:hypothetical protein